MSTLRSVLRSWGSLGSLAVVGLAALVGLCASGCGGATGGAEAGNPSLTVVGSVPDSPDSEDGCEADQVVATDSRDREFEANVAQDCSFELSLPAPEAYRLDLLQSGLSIASLEFDNAPGRFASPAMNLAPANDTVYLNQISVDDETATASREPATQIDQNGDGLPDFADRDDDGDGILDTEEGDCDLDGLLDDFDADAASCPSEPDFVLEVSPRNGEGLGTHGIKAKTTEEIKLRLSCAVDAATLVASSLQIAPDNDPTALLLCTFAITGSGKQVRCDHAELLPDTVYRARLEGVRCEDGADIPAVAWSWRTR